MGALVRISGAVTRRPAVTIALWAAVLAAANFVGPTLDHHLVGITDDTPGSESSRVRDILATQFDGRFNQTALVVFYRADLVATESAYSDLVNATLAAVENRPEIKAAFSAFAPAPNPSLISHDGHTTYIVAGFVTNDGDEAGRQIPQISAAVSAVDHASFEVYVTGVPAALFDIQRISNEDAERAESMAIPLAIVVLIFVLGGILAAFLPLGLGLVSILLMFGAAALIAPYYSMSVYVKNIGIMLGLGLGTDYSLLIVSRFKEEVRKGRAPREAAIRAGATAGRAVAFSGATVALGFAALLAPDISLIRSIGLGGLIIVATSVLVAITLLPAVLTLVGPRIEWPLALSSRLARLRPTGFWERAARRVLRRPRLYLAAVLVLLVPLSLVSYGLTPITPGASSLPDEAPSHRGLALLEQGFGPGINGPIFVTVGTPALSAFDNASLDVVDALTRAVLNRSDIDSAVSLTHLAPNLTLADYKFAYHANASAIAPFDPGLAGQVAELQRAAVFLVSRDLRTTLVTIYLDFDSSNPRAQEVVRELRGTVLPALALPAGYAVMVGGTPANALDTNAATYSSFVIVVVFILGATYLILLVLFRSAVLPLKTILENILSVSASIGFLVLIFEYGWGTSVFGFPTYGGVTYAIPAIQFALLFGLSMDYQIFILARIKEEWDATHDNDRAVAYGLEKTGGVVTSAALVMIAVFGLFSTSDLIFLKELGLGLTFAVLVDATLVRTVAVPAGMKLLASRNWYIPRFLDARLPHVSIEADAAPSGGEGKVGEPKA